MAQSGLVIDKNDCIIVRLDGNARVETATLLKESLAQAQMTHNVAVEWDQAEHVDACVLQVLLALRKLLSERGLSLTVGKDNAKVRKYLKLSGLSEYFPAQSGSSEPCASGDSNA